MIEIYTDGACSGNPGPGPDWIASRRAIRKTLDSFVFDADGFARSEERRVGKECCR